MNYIIEDSVMSSIADSIRAKTGTSEAFQVTDFASAIDSIPSGGGDEDWINYVEGNTTTVSGSASKIRNNAFMYINITEASFPSCANIGDNAFSACTNLTTVSFPECTTIGSSAFQFCAKLATASFPKCTNIGDHAFSACTNLTTASFPVCSNIGNRAFQFCSSLAIISFPVCSNIGSDAFRNCSKLTTASFPSCTNIGSNAFYNCTSLETVSFPSCIIIRISAFQNCKSLSSLYLNSVSNVTTLNNINAFTNTPMTNSTYLGYFGSIYVPLSLVDAFKSATNWVTYMQTVSQQYQNQ